LMFLRVLLKCLKIVVFLGAGGSYWIKEGEQTTVDWYEEGCVMGQDGWGVWKGFFWV